MTKIKCDARYPAAKANSNDRDHTLDRLWRRVRAYWNSRNYFGFGRPNWRSSQARQRGFTLLELIIVLVVISVLLSVAIPRYQETIRAAKESVLKQNLYLMRRQIEAFAADNGRYPESLQQLVDKGYLRELPLDPITDSRETWQEIREDSTGLSPTSQPGIVDVRSGAEGESLEGKPYSEL